MEKLYNFTSKNRLTTQVINRKLCNTESFVTFPERLTGKVQLRHPEGRGLWTNVKVEVGNFFLLGKHLLQQMYFPFDIGSRTDFQHGNIKSKLSFPTSLQTRELVVWKLLVVTDYLLTRKYSNWACYTTATVTALHPVALMDCQSDRRARTTMKLSLGNFNFGDIFIGVSFGKLVSNTSRFFQTFFWAWINNGYIFLSQSGETLDRHEMMSIRGLWHQPTIAKPHFSMTIWRSQWTSTHQCTMKDGW